MPGSRDRESDMPHVPHDAVLLGTILGVLVEVTRPLLLLGPGDRRTGEALAKSVCFTWSPGLAIVVLQSIAMRDTPSAVGLGLSFLLAASSCRLFGYAMARWLQ
jgi:hypothetical protein